MPVTETRPEPSAGVLVLACGDAASARSTALLPPEVPAELVELPAIPDRTVVDPALRALADRRLIIAGGDDDLAEVVLRLLRTERLAVPLGYLPTASDSAVGRLWGLPTDPAAAAAVACLGELDRVPLIRDDNGGVLLGLGTVGPLRGVVYCDDATVLRGQARRLEVSPDPGGGLTVTLRRGPLRRPTRFRGRAVQIGSLPVTPVHDGVRHPRPVTRWTWYRHTEDLRVALRRG